MVPGDDLLVPVAEGSSELLDFGGAGFVLEVRGELLGVFVSFPGVGGLVDSPDGFFSVSCELDFAVGVSRAEQAGQSLPAVVVEPFAGEGEEFAYPV